MKLKKALKLFLIEYQHSPNTYRAYSGVLTRLIDAIGAERKLKRIQSVDLTDYLADLRKHPEKYATHPTRPTLKAGYSEATINKIIKTVKRFFKWCADNGHIKRNPAKSLHQKLLPRHISREKAMSSEELDKLLPFMRRKPRDYALLMFVADSGCRAGGVATLTIDRVDLVERQALVTEKGSTGYYVKFGEATAAVLHAWIYDQRPEVDHRFVFTSDHTPFDPLKPAAVSQVIRRGCKALGLRSLGSHSIRHRKGHQLAGKGVAITTAADIMGHKSIESTKGYFQQPFDEIMQIADSLTLPAPTVPDNITDILKYQKK